MFQIDPRHDVAALAGIYAAKRRIQVRDFLADADAEEISEILTARTPWGLVFNRGTQVVQLSPDQVAALTPDQQTALLREVQTRAQTGYQFLYSAFPLLSAYCRHPAADLPIFRAIAFVNSPAFLNFTRRLTGLSDVTWADAHATQFRAGHFLKFHTDETPAEKRRAAYVLNFTRDWGRDWGGYLQFFNERFDVEDAYRPVFNALNIFTVPSDHSVGMVSTYAPAGRYSITGWLRADEPPEPIARLL